MFSGRETRDVKLPNLWSTKKNGCSNAKTEKHRFIYVTICINFQNILSCGNAKLENIYIMPYTMQIKQKTERHYMIPIAAYINCVIVQ